MLGIEFYPQLLDCRWVHQFDECPISTRPRRWLMTHSFVTHRNDQLLIQSRSEYVGIGCIDMNITKSILIGILKGNAHFDHRVISKLNQLRHVVIIYPKSRMLPWRNHLVKRWVTGWDLINPHKHGERENWTFCIEDLLFGWNWIRLIVPLWILDWLTMTNRCTSQIFNTPAVLTVTKQFSSKLGEEAAWCDGWTWRYTVMRTPCNICRLQDGWMLSGCIAKIKEFTELFNVIFLFNGQQLKALSNEWERKRRDHNISFLCWFKVPHFVFRRRSIDLREDWDTGQTLPLPLDTKRFRRSKETSLNIRQKQCLSVHRWSTWRITFIHR